MSSRKKVLLVITKSQWGGATRYVYDLATRLDPAHYEVLVAAGGDGPLKQRLASTHVPFIPVPGLQRDVNVIKESLVFFSLLRLFIKERPDIVHLNSSKIGGIGAVAARIAFVPHIVFTAHGFAFNEDRSAVSKYVLKFLYWFMMFSCTHTIVVSEGTKAQVARWPFLGRKLTVIHNAIDKPDFLSREEARDALADMSPPLKIWLSEYPSGTLVGSIGELHHIKGHNYSIRAIAQLPKDVALVIIGDGEERSRLEQVAHISHVENRVFFIRSNTAYRYLKAWDIFLLASLSEALAYVILEAGAAELPVIATRVGGIPEVIQDDTTGLLIPPRDPEAIAATIARLKDDPTTAQRLAHALKEKVAHEFNLEKMLAATEKVYRE